MKRGPIGSVPNVGKRMEVLSIVVCVGPLLYVRWVTGRSAIQIILDNLPDLVARQ